MTRGRLKKDQAPVFVNGKGVQIVDNRSDAPENASYRLSDHTCTQCLGRLLTRVVSRGKRPKLEWRCAECGDSHVLYADESSPCWCQKTAGLYGKIFMCYKNPDRSIVKNEILVREKPVSLKPPAERLYRPVFSTSTDYL